MLFRSGVDKNNRLSTESVTTTSLSSTSKRDGNAYTVGTDGVLNFNFTSGVDNAILYCKNNEDLDLDKIKFAEKHIGKINQY